MIAKIICSFYSLYSTAKDFLSNILWQTLSLQNYSKSVNEKQSNEDFIGLKPVEMILKRGYPIEIHHVITEDGYILSLYRIPYGKTDSDKSKPRIPVLLMHGLMASGADWVSSDNGLGYLLGENRFDVWISNARGTIPSKSHIDRNVFKNEKKYWDFSWQEIGYYDLPASIDYILSTTNHNKLFYIGHSQGATCFLAMTSTRPEYNNKIILSVLLAPTVFCINRQRELLMYFKRKMPLLKPITDFVKIYNVRGVNLIRFAGRLLGKNNSLFRPICVYVASLLIGYSDKSQFDEVNIEVVVNTTPSTCSLNQLYHFGQIMTSGVFCQFDYGEEENMRRYKSPSPPLYELSNVTSPVAIYYGKNDLHVSIADVDLLCSKLPNVVSKHLIGYELFNHVDFLYAKDVGSLLYNKIVDLMNNYGGNSK